MNEQKNLMPADRLPYLFQFDLPWKDEVYGDGTMEQTGCGPTSLAMALGGLLSQNFSPKEIADYAQANGYYVDGAGTAWAFLPIFPSCMVSRSGKVQPMKTWSSRNWMLAMS